MQYRASNGKGFIQFAADSEKEAKQYLKDTHGTGYKLLKDEIDYVSIFMTINKAKVKLSALIETFSLFSDIEIQEAKDYYMSKNELFAPYLIEKYGKKVLEDKVSEILSAVATHKTSIAKQEKEIAIALDKLNKAQKKLFTHPQEAIELLKALEES